MSDREWRGPVNQILYGLIYATTLDNQKVRQMARAMADRRHFVDGPEVYLNAIEAALASGLPLSETFETPHGEEPFRDFLGRLAEELRAIR